MYMLAIFLSEKHFEKMDRDIGVTLVEKVHEQECGPKYERLKSGSLYLLHFRSREDEM